jgi:hypothetical protein
MTEILGRLFPALREIRTPLAVGYAWLGLIWIVGFKLSKGDLDGDASTDLYRDTVAELPTLSAIALLTFLAVILGSGIVRLMDRIMQAIRRNRKTESNPLDKGRNQMVTEYVADKGEEDRASQEWGGPEDDPSLIADDRRLFIFYLRQDQNFGALESEQLMRFSLLPPVAVAPAFAVLWLVQDWWDWGIALLVGGLVAIGFVLVLDYKRIGTLLLDRWRSLADEYPTWLPDDALVRRNARYERVRSILDTDSGLRAFSGLSSEEGIDSWQKRLTGLRNTADELEANGAPLLAKKLRKATPDDLGQELDAPAAKDFRDLASKWNGVWKTRERIDLPD